MKQLIVEYEKLKKGISKKKMLKYYPEDGRIYDR